MVAVLQLASEQSPLWRELLSWSCAPLAVAGLLIFFAMAPRAWREVLAPPPGEDPVGSRVGPGHDSQVCWEHGAVSAEDSSR